MSTGISEVSPLQLADRAAEYHGLLTAELEPRGTLQSILVVELARHAAGLELAAQAEAASLQFAAENASLVQACSGSDAHTSSLVAAMGNGHVIHAARYRTGHEKAFYSALRGLTQAARLSQSSAALGIFGTEDECTQYLYRWQQQQIWQCPSCHSDKRFWLHSRAKFECVCRQQYSVRVNTLFAASHVPLLAWFRIVLSILLDPHVPIDDLARRVGIVRQATVRALARRVAA